jgi:putative ABC transport system ATP-binding protein
MNEASLIELRGIAKTYGRGDAVFHALRGVDLRIDRGEFVAIMGPSGSGKSTLMNLLGCLDTPTSGSYLFNGITVESLSKDQRSLIRRHALGFVFQGFNLLARTSALENVELPLLYRGVPARQRREMAREALASVGIPNKVRNTPAELSGGQQQRVAIARAIVTQPETLFADEPTGNLDSKTTVEIMELLCKLNHERGISIIMVTHEDDVAASAKRVVRVKDGLIASDERVGELKVIG